MNPVTQAWVQKAEQDFEAATWAMQKPGNPVYDTVCFHCQQCVEKLMKALLNEKGVHFPKTHELDQLCKLIQTVVPAFIPATQDLNTLAPGAVSYRYPGDDATGQEAQDAIDACIRLRALILPLL